jgi:hypothetical protein
VDIRLQEIRFWGAENRLLVQTLCEADLLEPMLACVRLCTPPLQFKEFQEGGVPGFAG